MALTREDVEKVALLARLKFSDEEIEKFKEDLNNILDYIHKLNELETDKIPPTSHVVEMDNVFREDVVGESIPIEDVLLNAPEKKDRFFVVPKVIETE